MPVIELKLAVVHVVISCCSNPYCFKDIVPRIGVLAMNQHEIVRVRASKPSVVLLMDVDPDQMEDENGEVERNEDQQCRVLHGAAVGIEKVRIDEDVVVLVRSVYCFHLMLYSVDDVGDEVVYSELQEDV
eukprot:CAMPEP_0185277728 /NCGR_PEP_ID=MMETSP1359-20130426/59255_1 /TAXON_ID=552665 /ORGANISM="Bigelowiella longifila, Strain CCMP242" /LENGTH=129 /DNA_ID=CAMNT_0027871933 /DNA_START=365 /DNA_END=754 /DNA_ORIENTATION=-